MGEPLSAYLIENPSVFASLSQLPYKGEPEKLSLPFIGEVPA